MTAPAPIGSNGTGNTSTSPSPTLRERADAFGFKVKRFWNTTTGKIVVGVSALAVLGSGYALLNNADGKSEPGNKAPVTDSTTVASPAPVDSSSSSLDTSAMAPIDTNATAVDSAATTKPASGTANLAEELKKMHIADSLANKARQDSVKLASAPASATGTTAPTGTTVDVGATGATSPGSLTGSGAASATPAADTLSAFERAFANSRAAVDTAMAAGDSTVSVFMHTDAKTGKEKAYTNFSRDEIVKLSMIFGHTLSDDYLTKPQPQADRESNRLVRDITRTINNGDNGTIKYDDANEVKRLEMIAKIRNAELNGATLSDLLNASPVEKNVDASKAFKAELARQAKLAKADNASDTTVAKEPVVTAKTAVAKKLTQLAAKQQATKTRVATAKTGTPAATPAAAARNQSRGWGATAGPNNQENLSDSTVMTRFQDQSGTTVMTPTGQQIKKDSIEITTTSGEVIKVKQTVMSAEVLDHLKKITGINQDDAFIQGDYNVARNAPGKTYDKTTYSASSIAIRSEVANKIVSEGDKRKAKELLRFIGAQQDINKKDAFKQLEQISDETVQERSLNIAHYYLFNGTKPNDAPLAVYSKQPNLP